MRLRESLLLLIILFSKCKQHGSDSKTIEKSFTIVPDIKSEVLKHIGKDSIEDLYKGPLLIYSNDLIAEVFENDSIVASTMDSPKKSLFKSFYYWNKDTLNIDGAFGMFTGIGFNLKIYKDTAILFHLLSSDEIPSYKMHPNDTATFRIEVPCTDSKIVLSQIPDSVNNPQIYGYVELKSDVYYQGDDKDPPRSRSNMKIYFTSKRVVF